MGTVLSPFFPVVIFTLAFFTAKALRKAVNFEPPKERIANIDALRGFLAIGVFVSHISLWFNFLHKGVWFDGIVDFYSNLGVISVSFFFMITSYLFVSRIINSALKPIQWLQFFVSRFLRLFPLYFFSLLLILLIVFDTSNWQLNVDLLKLVKNIFYWITFTIVSSGIINGNELTSIINAGVVWTLPFEWMFYFSLPLSAFIITRKNVGLVYLLIGLFFLLMFIKINGIEIQHILSFTGGALAPFLIKFKKIYVDYDRWYFSLFVILLFIIVFFLGHSHQILIRFCLTLIFTLIALGNTIFGILKSNSLKFLGEICYSTYLLHGIIIFIVLYYILGFESVKHFSIWNYYLSFILITPFVVFMSYLCFVFIEKPFMLLAKSFNYTR
jgi:peptidoglycan/LPS O-acetylase OafA/YrhL